MEQILKMPVVDMTYFPEDRWVFYTIRESGNPKWLTWSSVPGKPTVLVIGRKNAKLYAQHMREKLKTMVYMQKLK